MKTTLNGMTDRIRRLRQESFDTQPSLSIERALIETEFYKENEGMARSVNQSAKMISWTWRSIL